MQLSVPQMVRMGVAGFHDQDLAVGERELGPVQPAAVGTALDENQLVVGVPVGGILVVAFHAQPVEVVEDRAHPDAGVGLGRAAEAFLDYRHGLKRCGIG